MKNICFAVLAVVGMAWLVDAEAAAEMETRAYPAPPSILSQFVEAAEYAGLHSDDYDRNLADLLHLFGVDWPEGSGIEYVKTLGAFNVKNTPENLAKFEKVMDELQVDAVNIAIDVRFVETGRAALDAVGYFDTNRVDAAVLQERLLARGDVKLLDSVSAVTRPGEETLVKHVKEYIYPTDYDIFPCGKSADGTNSASRLFAAVEPQSFTMREAAGSIVLVTPTLTYDHRLIDLEFDARLVGEPEWKDYGAKANWEGAATYDLPIEQPFFPVRVSVDAKVSMSPGGTLVFGGVTDSRMANEDKFVLVFVTARCIDGAGETCAPPSHRVDEPEVWRKYESEGMEAWAFMDVASAVFCCERMAPDPAEKPKSPEEIAAERTKNIRERERNMMEFFAECAEAGWPEGSALHALTSLGRIWMKNTPENLAKIAKWWKMKYGPNDHVELDVRFISADRKALVDAGYFSANRANAAVLQERLMKCTGAKVLESPRFVTRPNEEAVLLGVLEYIYPTDYDIQPASAEMPIGTNAVVHGVDCAGAAVEPQSFTMREVGAIVQVTPTLTDDHRLIDLQFDARLVGEPEWKDYGAKAKWEGAATYDLPMEQPFFPVRVRVDAKVSMSPGATYVFGGGADTRKGCEDNLILVFVTPRIVRP